MSFLSGSFQLSRRVPEIICLCGLILNGKRLASVVVCTHHRLFLLRFPHALMTPNKLFSGTSYVRVSGSNECNGLLIVHETRAHLLNALSGFFEANCHQVPQLSLPE